MYYSFSSTFSLDFNFLCGVQIQSVPSQLIFKAFFWLSYLNLFKALRFFSQLWKAKIGRDRKVKDSFTVLEPLKSILEIQKETPAINNASIFLKEDIFLNIAFSHFKGIKVYICIIMLCLYTCKYCGGFFSHFCSCFLSLMLPIRPCFPSRCPWKGEMPELMPESLSLFFGKTRFLTCVTCSTCPS